MGGNNAAFGFRYQYLVTLERALELRARHANGQGKWTLRIDPPLDDAVDVQIREVVDGRTSVESIQIKASHRPGSYELSAPSAQRILERLARSAANRSTIHTNRRLTRLDSCWRKSVPPIELTPGMNVYVPAGSSPLAGSDKESYCVVVDTRDIDALSRDVVAAVTAVRANQGLTTGRRSVGALVSVLLDDVFRRAASLRPTELTDREFEELLRLDGQDLFRAVGSVDTGLILGSFPRHTVVERSSVSRSLDRLLDPHSAPVHWNGVGVVGLPGLGKTSAVSAWVRARRHLVDFVIWLSASGGDKALDTSVRTALYGLRDELAERLPAEVLCEFLEKTPLHWVLVMDDVDTTDITPYLPRTGSGHVILLSSARVGAVTDFPPVSLEPLVDQHEIEVYVAAALKQDATAWDESRRSAAHTLCAALGGFPVALTVACRELDALSIRLEECEYYLEHLTSIALTDVPDGLDHYPRTALQAVASAIQQALDDPRIHEDLVSQFLLTVAYLGGRNVPVGLAWAAATEPTGNDLDPSEPLEYDVLARADVPARRMLGVLSTYGLVQEVGHQLDDARPWPRLLSVRLTLHSVVLHAIGPTLRATDETRAEAAYATNQVLSDLISRSLDAADGVSLDLLATVAQFVTDGISEGRLPATARGLLILGNMSRIYRMRRRFDEAERLLWVERSYLLGVVRTLGTDTPWDPRRLLIKINIDLLMIHAEARITFSPGDQRLVDQVLEIIDSMSAATARSIHDDRIGLSLLDALTTFRNGVDTELIRMVMNAIGGDPESISGPLPPQVSAYLVERALRDQDGQSAQALLDRTPLSVARGAPIVRSLQQVETSALLGDFDEAVNHARGLLSYYTSTGLYRTQVDDAVKRLWQQTVIGVYRAGMDNDVSELARAVHHVEQAVRLWEGLSEVGSTEADSYRMAVSRALVAMQDRQPTRTATLRRALQQSMEVTMSADTYPTAAAFLVALHQLRPGIPEDVGMSFVASMYFDPLHSHRILVACADPEGRPTRWFLGPEIRVRFIRTYELALIEVSIPSEQPRYIIARVAQDSIPVMLTIASPQDGRRYFLIDDSGTAATEIPDFPGLAPVINDFTSS